MVIGGRGKIRELVFFHLLVLFHVVKYVFINLSPSTVTLTSFFTTLYKLKTDEEGKKSKAAFCNNLFKSKQKVHGAISESGKRLWLHTLHHAQNRKKNSRKQESI